MCVNVYNSQCSCTSWSSSFCHSLPASKCVRYSSVMDLRQTDSRTTIKAIYQRRLFDLLLPPSSHSCNHRLRIHIQLLPPQTTTTYCKLIFPLVLNLIKTCPCVLASKLNLVAAAFLLLVLKMVLTVCNLCWW